MSLAALAVSLCGCGPEAIIPSLAGEWEYQEEKRILSPDSVVEAVIVTGGAGATTATTTSLYLVPAGSRLDIKEEIRNNLNKNVFVADHLKNLTIVWKNPRLVEIGYEEARLHHFRNYWSHRDVQDYRFVVEVRLAPTTNEFALPWGDRHW